MKYEPDDDTVRDGESVRVPMQMMDAVQQGIYGAVGGVSFGGNIPTLPPTFETNMVASVGGDPDSDGTTKSLPPKKGPEAEREERKLELSNAWKT